MSEQPNPSPFHAGEREIQTRRGVRKQIEGVGQRFIRDHLPDEHRAFYEQLPFLLLGTVDASGRPWASVLAGRPGFIRSEERALRIAARRIDGDPLDANLAPGALVGILGIQYATRRRNRLATRVSRVDGDTLRLDVDQTFGNCPQYIQAREPELLPGIDRLGEPRRTHAFDALSERAREIIARADHFYIATHYSEDAGDVRHGADVSHRGGRPGFVRVDDQRTLMFPDFSGNLHFNTLGNILLNPLAGLLFIDFESGDLLSLTCHAEIIWDSDEKRAFDGAEQLVRLTLDEGVLIEDAMPMRWRFVDYSPSLEHTGTWEQVAETLAARKAGNVYRDYTVTRVERESELISSFYLSPGGDRSLPCHRAGQFLPIEIEPAGHDGPVKRTYTISNAPNGQHLRLSIKREPAAGPDLPAGLSSSHFHEQVTPGTTIRALPPRGGFVLEEASSRPVVLLSAGVGVTPMISMLEELAAEREGCGCERQVWFVHGARNAAEHAFRDHVRAIANDWPSLSTHFVYSRPGDGETAGVDYDSSGHIDVELLKTLLPFGDYDFYFCGPVPFMESIYAGLKNLNVADDRVHYEFFGPGATLLRDSPGASVGLVGELDNSAPVEVRFAASGKTAIWEPSKGTLLDLAESQGLRPAYSCRSGICATCSTHVVNGTVAYVDPPLAEPQAGEALICCSYPDQGAAEAGGLTLDL